MRLPAPLLQPWHHYPLLAVGALAFVVNPVATLAFMVGNFEPPPWRVPWSALAACALSLDLNGDGCWWLFLLVAPDWPELLWEEPPARLAMLAVSPFTPYIHLKVPLTLALRWDPILLLVEFGLFMAAPAHFGQLHLALWALLLLLEQPRQHQQEEREARKEVEQHLEPTIFPGWH